jgi:predicted MPP superfamily phosphohydrolase
MGAGQVQPPMSVETTPETQSGGDPTSSRPLYRITRRSFLTLAAAFAGGFALYSGGIARHELKVEEYTVHLPRLPDAFRGMRVAQVSDVHYFEWTETYFLREVVDHVNALKPDMVVLTGDFVTYGPLRWPSPDAHKRFALRHMPECASILSGIQCPLRYATLGNHDMMVGGRYVYGDLINQGLPVLRNRAVPLERNEQRLWVAGLGSACARDADPDRAIPDSAIRDKEAVIVLAHEPDILPEVAKYGADLMLSGHTHGGQVCIPFLPPAFLPEYGKRYVKGWFRWDSTKLYVNRGIGTIGVPFRVNCPPEITLLTLA